jgi:hypothetical protein
MWIWQLVHIIGHRPGRQIMAADMPGTGMQLCPEELSGSYKRVVAHRTRMRAEFTLCAYQRMDQERVDRAHGGRGHGPRCGRAAWPHLYPVGIRCHRHRRDVGVYSVCLVPCTLLFIPGKVSIEGRRRSCWIYAHRVLRYPPHARRPRHCEG